MAWLTSYGDDNLVIDSVQTVIESGCTYDSEDETWTIWTRTNTITEKRYVGMDYDTAEDCRADMVDDEYNATLIPENNGGGYSVRWTEFSGGTWAEA